MNELLILYGDKPGRIIKSAMDNEQPLRMSYMKDGKWTARRVFVTGIRPDNFDVAVTPYRRNEEPQIQPGTSAGLSLHSKKGDGYDNFVFGTRVVAVKWSGEDEENPRLLLNMPEEIEMVQRRNYMRAKVPKSMQVEVKLWDKGESETKEMRTEYIGQLIDISAGGVQVGLSEQFAGCFRHGNELGIEFVPLANETPMRFNARVKSALPTADGKSICLGMEMVGLEASAEGRLVLQRICSIVEQYRRMNEAETNKINSHSTKR